MKIDRQKVYEKYDKHCAYCFEGTLIFSRDGLLEFVDVTQNYYNARIGKCKITRI